MKLNAAQKELWYEWNDKSYSPTVLVRLVGLLLFGLVIIGFTTYETFPFILEAFAGLLILSAVGLFGRWLFLTIRYRIRCWRSQRGTYRVSVVDKS